MIQTSDTKAVVKTLTGNHAAAYAGKLARVGGVFFFPIGPADEVGEKLSEFIVNGELPGSLVMQMDSERGCANAQAAMTQFGVRTIFPTSSHGLLWAWPQLVEDSLIRVTTLTVVATRSFGSSVRSDWEDFILCRDTGALLYFAENSQDILDTIIQAYRVAEDERVSLPVMVGYDGWDVSHGTFVCHIPDQEKVDAFLPPYRISAKRDPLAQDWYNIFQLRRESPLMEMENGMETEYLARQAAEKAKKVTEEVGEEYKKLFGRDYVGVVEYDRCEDAEVVILTMGGLTGTARFVADLMREQGEKVGVAKLRLFRPFPKESLLDNLKQAKVIITLERDRQAAIYDDTRAALYGSGLDIGVLGRVVGIAGRDVSYSDIMSAVEDGLQAAATGEARTDLKWVPLKGVE